MPKPSQNKNRIGLPSEKRFAGKLALITGANRGIGLAIARALAIEGCDLVITGRDSRSLNKAVRELGPHGSAVLGQICEVRDPVSVEELFASIRREEFLHGNRIANFTNLTKDSAAVRAEFPDRFVQTSRVTSSDDEIASFDCQRPRNGEADAAICARDQSQFPGEALFGRKAYAIFIL